MAEHDPMGSDAVNAPHNGAQRVNAGSDTTNNGRLERSDVTNAPFQRGTDALGDHRQLTRSNAKVIMAAVLLVLFSIFLTGDIANGDHVRTGVGAAVMLICIALLVTELRKPKAGKKPKA